VVFAFVCFAIYGNIWRGLQFLCFKYLKVERRGFVNLNRNFAKSYVIGFKIGSTLKLG
jgi:hypothetical protein